MRWAVCFLALGVMGCTAAKAVFLPAKVAWKVGTLPVRVGRALVGPRGEEGVASWYGAEFHGKRTASGEIYDMFALTAAHRRLPFGTLVEVTNLENGRKVVVRINDRGPFKKGRIIDLSYAAARRLGMVEQGTARVRLRVIRRP